MYKRNKFKRIKIVKFDDGKYGIRKGWFFYSFLDIDAVDRGNCYWWSGKYRIVYHNSIKIPNLIKIKKIYEMLLDNGEPV